MSTQILVLAFILMISINSFAGGTMKPWFKNSDYTKLEIIKYKSISEQEKIDKTLTIEDNEAIKEIVSRINQINADGNEMIKPGPTAAYTILKFHQGGQIESIEILNNMIKTPSTGFNSKTSEVEKSVLNDINHLLKPEFKKAILKIKGLELPFSKFTLTYMGQESKKEDNATVTIQKDFFAIKDSKKHIEKIQILSGQLPPTPYEYKIEKQNFKLLTYETKDNFRLYPKYFEIL